MRIDSIDLVRLRMPLVSPFRTSFGVQDHRDVLLVKLTSQGVVGWGECVALSTPMYNEEHIESAHDVVRRFLSPILLRAGDIHPAELEGLFAEIHSNRMAKSAVEMAVLDAFGRQHGLSMSGILGGVRREIPVGVSVGIMKDIPTLLAVVGDYLADGYGRVKLKIEPGWDVEILRAVRDEFGDDLALQVDANCGYRRADMRLLTALDGFGLLMIEQPFAADDLEGHAALQARIETPVCIDESATSPQAVLRAIETQACRIVNIKTARVGGLLQARRIHDVCVAAEVPVWCGGMLESGVGRAANIALAALPGFVYPADISASSRYFQTDVVSPFVLTARSTMTVPTDPGLGVEVDEAVLTRLGARVESVAG